MNDIDSIRLKKLEELKSRIQEQEQNEQLLNKQIELIEHEVKKKLSREAIARYGNIKFGNPDLALQVLMILAQIIEKDKRKDEKISDDQLKRLLQLISVQKKQTKIERV